MPRTFGEKPKEGWLVDQRGLKAGRGIFYSFPLQYIGNVEVRKSLRGLTGDEQMLVLRDLIATVVETAGLRSKSARVTPRHLREFLEGDVATAVIDINLNISAEGIMIVPVEIDEDGEVTELGMLTFSEMRFISLASGGEGDDYCMVTYVGKTHAGERCCHVFDCGEYSDEVLDTLGQAFLIATGQEDEAESVGGGYDHVPSRSMSSNPYARVQSLGNDSLYEDLPAGISQANMSMDGGMSNGMANISLDNPLYNKTARLQNTAGYFDVTPDQEPAYDTARHSTRKHGYDNPAQLRAAAAGQYSEPPGGAASGGAPGDMHDSYMDVQTQGKNTTGDRHAPAGYLDVNPRASKESPYDNPMFESPYDFAKRSSEGLYAELPAEAISKVKSQYQHVDLLPRLPDNVYEGENRQQVVEVLNQTDPVRRVVSGRSVQGSARGRPSWVYQEKKLPPVDLGSIKSRASQKRK